MTMSARDQIAQQALALPSEDRQFLIDLLEQSFSQLPPFADVSATWTAEIDRRVEAYERGETQAVDAQTAIEEMRRQFAERRTERAS